MNKTILFLVFIGIIAVLTNPNKENHKEAIKDKFSQHLQNTMKESLGNTDTGIEQAGQALGLVIGTALADTFIDKLISSDNYLFFSTTKLNWEGKSKIIGIGAFGNVFISKQLNEKLSSDFLEENQN